MIDETYDTLVVGGGQAGLAAGYYLAMQGEHFLILDEGARTGDAWRRRWDSLRLFTPSQFDGLPGMPFPQPAYSLPTKDEVADYLEAYAGSFKLPIRHGVKVEALCREGAGYQLVAGGRRYFARKVIVATGPFRQPFTPGFAAQLDPAIFQLHSDEYRNPAQVAGAAVLVVGAGNSGVEIGIELASAGKQVWLSGRDVGQIPANTLGKAFGGKPYWWMISRILSVGTPIGRKMKSNILEHGNPLIRSNRKDAAEAGVRLTARMAGVQSGQPQLEGGQILPVDAVIWATGYRPAYPWIDLPIFDERGFPRHQQGVVREAPGLYFVGLHFQTALTSALLGGVGADARRIVAQFAENGAHAG